MRYHVAGDAGAWAETSNVMITYAMAAPNPPQSLAVQLLRDRVDTIPDVVKVTWQKAATNPGDSIEIICYDFLDKRHVLYTSNGSETEARIENVSRFIVQDTGRGPGLPESGLYTQPRLQDRHPQRHAPDRRAGQSVIQARGERNRCSPFAFRLSPFALSLRNHPP